MPPVDVSSAAGLASNFGFAGIIFVIWLFDMRKQDALQKVIADQVEDKQIMRDDKAQLRDDRNKLLEIIAQFSALQERSNNILLKIEKKL